MNGLTRQQIREIDRLATEELGIPGVVLMENAGRHVADVIMELLEDEMHLVAHDAKVTLFCGGGNNGGDGYVIARHLANNGVQVTMLAVCDPAKLGDDAAVHHEIAKRMDLVTPADNADALAVALAAGGLDAHVIVDALLGTGFEGEVRDHVAHAIDAINEGHQRGAAVVAVDVPSGLDCETGEPSNAVVHADTTVTFTAPKTGLTLDAVAEYVGMLIVADIGAPPQLIDTVLRQSAQA